MLGRLSLRARLLLGVIVLTAAGLLVADLVTYKSLESFLIDRVDSTLNTNHMAIENAVLGGGRGPGQGGGPGGPPGALQPVLRSIPGYCIETRTLKQQVLQQFCIPAEIGETATAPGPMLPATITLPAADGQGDRVTFLTVPATSGGDRYRVRASIEAGTPNRILLIAAPLSSVDSTLHRLLLIELLVTIAVLAAMTAVGLWVIRAALRPLDAMGKTAAAIAAGDLTQRVEPATDQTEVGRLGLALNGMLENIEQSATERDNSLRALEASEAKLRRFVADASHELRTPLAAVRAHAELFSRGAATRPDDLERSMAAISRESERMSVLVEDLLLLAHLDEGRPLEREPVALDEVVAESVETARTIEPGRPIEAQLAPATVTGDRDRLRQVVDNLLANVRAHTPSDAPLRITIEHDGTDASLTVADSGPGMDAATLEHAFERFYRADPSRARASGGAGLGLAIVSAVVEAHGGKVAVESAPDVGTTFNVRLPLAES